MFSKVIIELSIFFGLLDNALTRAFNSSKEKPPYHAFPIENPLCSI